MIPPGITSNSDREIACVCEGLFFHTFRQFEPAAIARREEHLFVCDNLTERRRMTDRDVDGKTAKTDRATEAEGD